MIDPLATGLLIAAVAGVFGMFIRIENRLTKVETTLTHIREHMTGCQPPSEENMK